MKTRSDKITNPNGFYVYGHMRADFDSLFYVGKGHGRRYRQTTNRNKHWKHIVNKHGYTTKIFYEGLTEEEAFQKEKELIALFGREEHGGMLCNYTDGGDGPSGTKISEERKQLISRANKGKIVSKETREKLSIAGKGKPKSREHVEQVKRTKASRDMSSCYQKKKYPNKTGFRGVGLTRNPNIFYAAICFKAKKIRIGHFKSITDAARAYDKKAIELYGIDASLNFPKEDYIND